MFIGLIHTNERTIKVVTITILLKLLLTGFVAKSLQAKQKTTAFFLPIIKNPKKRELNKNEISWQLQPQMPTKVWHGKLENTSNTINFNYTSPSSPQHEYDGIKTVNLNKKESLAKPIEHNNIEEKIINTFIQRIHNPIPLHVELKNRASGREKSRIITIISSFPISKPKCQDLAMAIRKNIAPDAIIKFRTKDNPIREIELRDRGYKISGNLNNYIIEIVRKAKTTVNY